MKKFFFNKKLMTFLICLCLGTAIIAIGIYAGLQNGLPGIKLIGKVLESSEPEILSDNISESKSELNTEIVIGPMSSDAQIENIPVVYSLPERMMAVTLTIGKDIVIENESDTEAIKKSIDTALENAKKLSANSVFIVSDYGYKVLFDADGMEQTIINIDLLNYFVQKAKEQGLYVFSVLNVLNVGLDCENVLSQIAKNAKALAKYSFDGILLDYYTVNDGVYYYKEYLEKGDGMGYENYLRSYTEAMIKTAYNAIKNENPAIAVGLAADAVWANLSDNEAGSDTTADYQSLYDGYADTKNFVEKGLADFVSVKCPHSTISKKAKFADYTSWWSTAISEKVPFYIYQYASKACTDERGWTDPSELSDQIISAEKLTGFCGSIFDSLTELERNPKQSTDALIQYLTENIDPSFLLTQLEMTRPSKTTYSTYEATASFSGASDVNFDLTMNGEKVKRDSNGAFMITLNLEPGQNKFVFAHKEKTVTYNITRNVKILKEVTPLGKVTVGGGMSITVTALAYEGSTVTATLGSKTVTLTPSTEVDDSTDSESTYIMYVGTISAPAATNSEQNLGNISISGKWNGFTETATGAAVTVSEKAKAGGLVEVVADAAETFPTNTLNDLSDYDCYPLAKGTRDYVVGEEITYVEGSTTYSYYNLQSGQRVYTKDVKPVSGNLGGNKISKMTVSSNKKYTYVTFETDQRVAYIAKYSSSAFTIDFQYTEDVPDNLSLECTPLFSSAKWNGSKLTLKLSTSGGFLGYYAYYDDGDLVFRFNNPTGTYSLSGVPIVVDVGHSALGVGALGYLSAYGEYEINLAVCKYLKRELNDRGATVYMMDTENQRPSLEDRTAYASSVNPLVFVSVHCNSSTTSTGNGTECFYFTRFSSLFADYFSDNVSDALGSTNRGGRLGRYYVTRVQNYPSVLGEIGFVSNETEYYKLIQSSYQRSIAEGIADAIESYLGSVGRNGNYSYGTQSTDGSSSYSSSESETSYEEESYEESETSEETENSDSSNFWDDASKE